MNLRLDELKIFSFFFFFKFQFLSPRAVLWFWTSFISERL